MMGEPTKTADQSLWELMDSVPTVMDPVLGLTSDFCMFVTVVLLGLFLRVLEVRSGPVPGN